MLNFLKKAMNKTYTENDAITYRTSESDCLDLFATIGALRQREEDEIIALFDRAWCEDSNLAIKTLFFARDIRGGLGERSVFRTILVHIANNYSESVKKNLWAIAEFGRFDDYLHLLDTPVKSEAIACLKKQFDADITALEKNEEVSLLGKWLPSINAHNKNTIRYGKMLAKAFGLRDAEYRKSLSALREKIDIIENKLREKNYTFDYSKQPSKAMLKYRKAFIRNDEQRYNLFLTNVERGEAVLKTGALFPYEIIRPIFESKMYGGIEQMSPNERRSLNVTWQAQADFTNNENALVVVDGSGSMYSQEGPRPIEVAVSLGLYFAERNTGAFHNHFITFSENPRLVEVKGKDIYSKVKHAATFDEVANTNIEKVFELILQTARKNKISQSELPNTIYIISDMEFDACAEDAELTNFECAQRNFEKYGYTLPKLVFWNVASRNQQQPVTMNEQGVTLVSGASPRVFAMLSSGNLSPYSFMLDTVNVERYDKISA